MAKPVFQLVRKHGVIASQNTHLGRSIYSIPFPIKIREVCPLNVLKSKFVAEIKPSVPSQLVAIDSTLAYVGGKSIPSSKVEFKENFNLPPLLEAIDASLAYVGGKSIIQSKLEAKTKTLAPQLESVSATLAYVGGKSYFYSKLNVVAHKQKPEIIELNTLKSTHKVKDK